MALLALAKALLAVAVTYSYLATDGWYDPEMFAFSMLTSAPFVVFAILAAVRVRRHAGMPQVELPKYSKVLRRVALYSAGFAACVAVVGVYGTVTTLYGGIVFAAVLVIGVPALTACVFLFSWTSWLFGRFCLRSR